jgi:hypothetical protein
MNTRSIISTKEKRRRRIGQMSPSHLWNHPKSVHLLFRPKPKRTKISRVLLGKDHMMAAQIQLGNVGMSNLS